MSEYVSFNPCSRGCCARSHDLPCSCKREEMFQSLFSWMLRSKSGSEAWVNAKPAVSILVLVDVALEASVLSMKVSAAESFNPCSRGCCARSARLKRCHGRSRVSILVLVDVALEGCRDVHLRRNDRFQSLFSWMLRSKSSARRLRNWRGNVSILVLVDVALEDSSMTIFEKGELVSILVLVDVALEDREISRIFR